MGRVRQHVANVLFFVGETSLKQPENKSSKKCSPFSSILVWKEGEEDP